jgi:hypothetical protein
MHLQRRFARNEKNLKIKRIMWMSRFFASMIALPLMLIGLATTPIKADIDSKRPCRNAAGDRTIYQEQSRSASVTRWYLWPHVKKQSACKLASCSFAMMMAIRLWAIQMAA